MSIRITPFLWFDGNAEEAANFYVSIFKNSKIRSIAHYPKGTPGPAGSVMTVDFELEGQQYTALNGGPHFKFNEAVSFVVHCKTQKEVDRYWDALTADGGKPVQCGWLTDKYGLSWQIVPEIMLKWNLGKEPKKTQAAFKAMMKMVKLDIAKLKAAYDKG